LGCSPLWPIAKQREAMNPIPATKTIKRLYYYSVTVFYIKQFAFKLGGVQVRGKNAATFQMIYMVIILFVNFIKVFWHIFISILWFGFLSIKWIVDFTIGFFKGFKSVNHM
jgi:hypothetical protein